MGEKEYTESHLKEIVECFKESGLNGIPFWSYGTLSIFKCDKHNIEVRYWLGLAYFTGFADAQKDPIKAWEIIAPNGELDDRLSFCYGYAYYGGLGVTRDLDIAIQWLEKSCRDDSPSAWYFLGECYRLKGEQLRANKPECFAWRGSRPVDPNVEPNLTRRQSEELFGRAYGCFHNATRLGCAQAYLKLADCSDMVDEGRKRKRLESCVRMSSYDWVRESAYHGLAEGWRCMPRSFGKKISTVRDLPEIDDAQKALMAAWCFDQNITRACYLGKTFLPNDALSLYVAGVSYDCGLGGVQKNGKRAAECFRAASVATEDFCGFVRELAQEHLHHLCSLKEYSSAFSDGMPEVARRYIQYMVSVSQSQNDYAYEYDAKRQGWRGFVWWYKLKLADILEDPKVFARELLESCHSPDAGYLMSTIDGKLYQHVVDVWTEDSEDNHCKWLTYAADEGSLDAHLALARYYQAWKCNNSEAMEVRGGERRLDNWYQEAGEFDVNIVDHLRSAYEWGSLDAGYELTMAARYGKVAHGLSNEEIATRFRSLAEKGHKCSYYEYAFCLYAGFGVVKDVSAALDGIRDAAFANYPRGRSLYEKEFGFTYWDDYDRGCQEI